MCFMDSMAFPYFTAFGVLDKTKYDNGFLQINIENGNLPYPPFGKGGLGGMVQTDNIGNTLNRRHGLH